MKSNVNIPDSVAQAAECLAKKLDVSLSELYTAALSSYVTLHQRDVTKALNRLYADERSNLDPELVKVQVDLLKDEQW